MTFQSTATEADETFSGIGANARLLRKGVN